MRVGLSCSFVFPFAHLSPCLPLILFFRATLASWRFIQFGYDVRIAVIGCGYVGGALAAELVRRGHHVVGTTTSEAGVERIAALGASPAVLTLDQRERLRTVLTDRDAVVVMVAPSRDDEGHREVYLEGMRHLMATLPGTPVRQVLYTSSTSVYGQRDGSWVNEESPTEPGTSNGQVLIQTERELLDGAAWLHIAPIVVRLAGIIGPNRGPAKRVPAFAGKPRDDGDGFVNLIHRDDIVTACTLLLERGASGVFNCSDGRPIRRRDFYDRIIAAHGLAPIQWTTPLDPIDLGKRIDNRRIVETLGMQFRDASNAC